MKKAILLMLAAMCLVSVYGQSGLNNKHSAMQYLEERGEVYFSFLLPSSCDQQYEILNLLSVDKRDDNLLFAYAGSQVFHDFLSYGIDYNVLLPPGLAYTPAKMTSWDDLQTADLTDSWDFYPTYDAYVQLMYHFQETYPERVKIYSIGATASGERELLFARIQPDVHTLRAVPQFMYTATIHGDETVGFILSLRLIHFLISQYGIKDDVTWLLDHLDIWICPNENPDGTYTNNNETLGGATRFNANGVDLNRNYPNPILGPPQSQQAETTAMINFTDTMSFIMSANMHGGAELVNYPFDSWKSNVRKHADNDWFDLISKEYADTAQTYSHQGYFTDLDGYSHGGDWYVIRNSRQDYMNYYRSIREVTLELSGVKLLPESQLDLHWEYNYRSLLNYMKQATYGISGFVYDAENDQPLEALIEVTDHDEYGSTVSSSLPHGFFHRPIKAGIWNLRVSAEGYDPKIISDLELTHNERMNLDIPLEKSVNVADRENPSFSAILLLNPIQTHSSVELFFPVESRLRAELISMTGRVPMVLFDDILPAGMHQIAIGSKMTRLPAGVYVIRLLNRDETIYLHCVIP